MFVELMVHHMHHAPKVSIAAYICEFPVLGRLCRWMLIWTFNVLPTSCLNSQPAASPQPPHWPGPDKRPRGARSRQEPSTVALMRSSTIVEPSKDSCAICLEYSNVPVRFVRVIPRDPISAFPGYSKLLLQGLFRHIQTLCLRPSTSRRIC